MSDTVIVALLSFAGSIIVALISLWGIKSQGRKHQEENDTRFSNFQTDVRTDIKAETQVAFAVMNNEIKHLTDEVRKHNNFAERIPAIEKDLETAKEDIKDIKEKLNQV